jgi:opacity protein-like surface antigen
MKKSIFTLLLVLITLNVKAQEESKQKELGFNVTGKLGFAKLNQSGMVLLNGSINAGDVLFFYRLPSGTTFSTGIGLMDFNANGVSAGESYALKQSYLRIPINLNYSLYILEDQLDSKLSAYGGIGVYANALLKEEVQTIDETFKNRNQGWNAGLGFNVGLRFGVAKNLNFGIGFESQSDFTKMKKNGVERKLEEINTINFSFEFKF